MPETLLAACALVLVHRGPAAPCSRRARGATRFAASTELSDGQLRFIGLASHRLHRQRSILIGDAMRNWVLPEYIEDILPAEAEAIERLRRTLLDHFRAHGYRLVQPPLVEHLESLLTGTGHDLELQTFKVVDPLSGRLLGVRADITPQVARIDAHLLNEPGVTRLCYAGSVLRTVAAGLAQTREVLQIGAELYGDAEHRRRPGSARTAAVVARCRRRRAACTSTSATSASIARSPTARTSPATAATASCSRRCATRTCRRWPS